jgi:hypothetical protein
MPGVGTGPVAIPRFLQEPEGGRKASGPVFVVKEPPEDITEALQRAAEEEELMARVDDLIAETHEVNRKLDLALQWQTAHQEQDNKTSHTVELIAKQVTYWKGALAVLLLLTGAVAWAGNRVVTRMDDMERSVQKLQVDVELLKREVP